MNRYAMPRTLALALAFTLAACSPSASVQADEEPPLAGTPIGGEFKLVDQAGETRRWEDFRGKYAVVYFGYTYCPDVCPTDMQRTAQGLRLFGREHPERRAKVQQIFISTDPARDTPEVVGEFAAAFSDDIVALTGTSEQVKSAADAFRVYYEKGEEAGEGAYLVNHTNITYLFGPEGEPLATLPTDLGPQAVAEELGKWVR